MRATAENVEAAVLSGIERQQGVRVCVRHRHRPAALGGVLMATTNLLSIAAGALGLLAFPAAVIGGLASIPGAVVGGLVVGVIQSCRRLHQSDAQRWSSTSC